MRESSIKNDFNSDFRLMNMVWDMKSYKWNGQLGLEVDNGLL